MTEDIMDIHIEPEKDIIHLQHAHVTQYSGKKGKTAWFVRKNITNETIAELDGLYTEKQVFEILDFARKFELEAFNEGIKLGKEKTVKVYGEIIKKMEANMTIAREENERIAGILEKHIGSED